MLEALKQIQEAEEQNKRSKEKLQTELAEVESDTTKFLEDLKQEEVTAVKERVAKKQERFVEQLAKEKRQLEQELAMVQEQLNARYEEKRDSAVATIIERVKQVYGRS